MATQVMCNQMKIQLPANPMIRKGRLKPKTTALRTGEKSKFVKKTNSIERSKTTEQ